MPFKDIGLWLLLRFFSPKVIGLVRFFISCISLSFFFLMGIKLWKVIEFNKSSPYDCSLWFLVFFFNPSFLYLDQVCYSLSVVLDKMPQLLVLLMWNTFVNVLFVFYHDFHFNNILTFRVQFIYPFSSFYVHNLFPIFQTFLFSMYM